VSANSPKTSKQALGHFQSQSIVSRHQSKPYLHFPLVSQLAALGVSLYRALIVRQKHAQKKCPHSLKSTDIIIGDIEFGLLKQLSVHAARQ